MSVITRQELSDKIRQVEIERQAAMVTIIPALQKIAYLDGQLALLGDLFALAGNAEETPVPHALPVD
jgi:hypothetical protein